MVTYLVLSRSDCAKPTYYFNEDGTAEVSYIEHAAFISAHSFVDPDDPEMWVYPMLKICDAGPVFFIYLEIDHYERKPRRFSTERYLWKGLNG